MIQLRLLGGLEMTETDGGSVLSVLSQPKRVGLLTYLLIAHPKGFHTRDKLLAFFWPEADEEHARNSLRQALHFLRRSLEADAILSRGEAIAVDASRFSCDVLAFDGAVVRREWEAALQLYRGPLMEGFHISGAPEFDRWLESERERLRVGAAKAAAEWVREEEEKGSPAKAIEAARRWAQISPASGPATQKLVELLARRGDRAGALRTFERFRKRLSEDLGLEPTDELTRVVEAIRGAADPAIPGGKPEPEEPSDVSGAREGPDLGSDVPRDFAPKLAPLPQKSAGPPGPPLGYAELRPSPAPRIIGPRATWTILVFVSMIALGYAVFLFPEVESRAGVQLRGFSDQRPTAERSDFSQRLLREVAQVMDSSEVVRPVTGDSDFRFLQYGSIDSDTVRMDLSDLQPGVARREWSYPFSDPPKEVDIQNLAIALVRDIELAVAGQSDLSLPTPGTANPLASRAYLEGRAYWLLRDPKAFDEARRSFERALEADSSYALAYSALADVYNLLGAYDYGIINPDRAYRLAKYAASRADSLERGLPQALAALATTEFFYEWDFTRAENHYRDALRLDPTYVHAHQWLSLLLAVQKDRRDEALLQIDQARQIDSSGVILAARARIHYFARDFGQALDWYEKALAADRDFVPANLGKGLTALMAGEYEMALAAYQDAERYLGGPAPIILAVKGHLFARTGRADEARELLGRLEQAKRRVDFVPPEYFAMIYVGLQDYDRAMDYLEIAFDNGSNVMNILEVEPLLDPLRSNLRFQDLERRVQEGRGIR